MNKFVSLVSHQGFLYALTEDGKIFRILDRQGEAVSVILLASLPNPNAHGGFVG